MFTRLSEQIRVYLQEKVQISIMIGFICFSADEPEYFASVRECRT